MEQNITGKTSNDNSHEIDLPLERPMETTTDEEDAPFARDDSTPVTSNAECLHVSELNEDDMGNRAPSFMLSINENGSEPGRTLYVYKDKASESKVTIKVVSMKSADDAESCGESQFSSDAGNAAEDVGKPTQVGPTDDRGVQHSLAENPAGLVPEDSTASMLYACEECSFTTKKKYNFLTHWVLHLKPNAKRQYCCSECSYATTLRYNLKTHMKRHANISELEDGEKFSCPECSYTTVHKHDMATHAKKHDPDKQHRCLHCDFTSIYPHSLLHHISSKHERVRPFQCKLCSFSAARKQDLETHMWKHSEEKRFKCSMCKYETPYKPSFEAHMNKHKGIKPFHCSEPDCSFSTGTKANLKSHMKRHTSRLQCEKCDFEASDIENLERHECSGMGRKKRRKISCKKKLQGVKNEEGKMEYMCEHCQFKTTNKGSFKRHGEKHEPGWKAPEKILVCEHCDYSTGYKSSLKRHLARHSLVKPLKCGHCEYSAINMSQMHLHIAKHTGIKPFKCNICSYASANKQHLVTHMAKHSNIRFKCDICGFTTAWRPRMNTHLKLHKQGKVIYPFTRRAKGSPLQSPATRTMATMPTTESMSGHVLVVFPNDIENFNMNVGSVGNLQVVNVDNVENLQVVNTGNPSSSTMGGDAIVINQNPDGTRVDTPSTDQGMENSSAQVGSEFCILPVRKIVLQQENRVSSDGSQPAEQCPENNEQNKGQSLEGTEGQQPASSARNGASYINNDV